uniref:Antitoxin component of toxin-antitoxin stability system, DNA-binding transcriptional repressor n=1 Tax=Candidatus Kentrum sp. FM TaxID=2126340 RepID=A0A450U279_9GAMM|nr:MAG: Antitoxin component of toxin-antitoxin stability system, DNA-binding transcriptional repressor [Candidatus Kentron sp. FM]VFJ76993.1 MAG: Antitoxin component of toxin-antitoxin stability system, DNA-binding transcriptional repressor [Candidatus Kentron sp. FM]VFK22764.1 MAG: Antitoxin component of toxin-antitoxin stability system, DNA-binding transcriptional repressor [Candidatus Kentron sp. FM]
MTTIGISELRSDLLNYLNSAKKGNRFQVTSKGVLLATINPPPNRNDAARDKLDKLAKTAIIRDVLSPAAENWNAME